MSQGTELVLLDRFASGSPSADPLCSVPSNPSNVADFGYSFPNTGAIEYRWGAGDAERRKAFATRWTTSLMLSNERFSRHEHHDVVDLSQAHLVSAGAKRWFKTCSVPGLLISPADQSNKSRAEEKRARSRKFTGSADPVGLRDLPPPRWTGPRSRASNELVEKYLRVDFGALRNG